MGAPPYASTFFSFSVIDWKGVFAGAAGAFAGGFCAKANPRLSDQTARPVTVVKRNLLAIFRSPADSKCMNTGGAFPKRDYIEAPLFYATFCVNSRNYARFAGGKESKRWKRSKGSKGSKSQNDRR